MFCEGRCPVVAAGLSCRNLGLPSDNLSRWVLDPPSSSSHDEADLKRNRNRAKEWRDREPNLVPNVRSVLAAQCSPHNSTYNIERFLKICGTFSVDNYKLQRTKAKLQLFIHK
ncbi:hypothetical protein CHARACLAT_022199 [Characodon lateralis]|uniref:Uncharacterized protein n=1 Tax=Characodon lateralis TaxID=208331 RepID=A0ABU7EMI4_9TELE|nr:hypothetical protein [Characodon lateralis]